MPPRSLSLNINAHLHARISKPDPMLWRVRRPATRDTIVAEARHTPVDARRNTDRLFPNLRDYAVKVTRPGVVLGESIRIQGEFVHDAIALNPAWYGGFYPDRVCSPQEDAPFQIVDQGCTIEMNRVYLPPDVNTMLCVTDRCLRSQCLSNVIVAGRQPLLQWLNLDAAMRHCADGIGIWRWASTDGGEDPDVVMGCCGDVPTQETLGAVDILRQFFPALKIRVVNVVDLMKLQSSKKHPHGLSEKKFRALFAHGRPIVFAFHGHAALIYHLTCHRSRLEKLKVLGCREEGPITSPFDRMVRHEVGRFHLVREVVECLPQLKGCADDIRRFIYSNLTARQRCATEYEKGLTQSRSCTGNGGLSA